MRKNFYDTKESFRETSFGFACSNKEQLSKFLKLDYHNFLKTDLLSSSPWGISLEYDLNKPFCKGFDFVKENKR